jgi:hypothetical protein
MPKSKCTSQAILAGSFTLNAKYLICGSKSHEQNDAQVTLLIELGKVIR